MNAVVKNQRSVLKSRTFQVLMVAFFAVALLAAYTFRAGASTTAADPASDLGTAIKQVAKASVPAVVHVEVTEKREMGQQFMPFQNDPFFRFFFDTPNSPRSPHQYKREMKGLGTGVIIDKEGHILTNNHVAGNADEINVVLDNGEKYKAELVGADPKTDLAVLKIDADKPLPYLQFGDSDKIEVGDWVVAIGHPRGLDQTVTQGIISAKHRTGITDPSSYQDFLQTDAAINPGNSGGPLLSLDGKVIGINTAIASQSGGFEGIGFAIPSNMAVHVSKALIDHGSVSRGWMGVSVQDLTPEMAKSFKLDSTKGALIADVIKGGPAEKAGVKRGDVIVKWDGKTIDDMSQLRNVVAATKIGEKVDVVVMRDSKEKTLQLTVGNMDDAAEMQTTSVKKTLGLEVRPVTKKDMEKYDLDSTEGVVATSVDPNSPLGAVGFEEGDIILQVNGQTVTDMDSFVSLAGQLKSGSRAIILALDHRTGRTGYLQITIP